MKVLYLVPGLNRQGPNIVIHNIIKNLDRKKFNPSIIKLFRGRTSLVKDFEKMKVPVLSLESSLFPSISLHTKKLHGLIDSTQPDIVHTHNVIPDYIVSKHFSKYPHCSTIHNFPSFDYPMTYGKFFGSALAKFHIRILKANHWPIACSNSLSRALENTTTFPPMRFIRNGVDTSVYQPVSSTKKNSLRKKLHLPEKKLLLISVGHLSHRKNPLDLIKAFKQCSKKYNALLIILGDGKLINQCKLATAGPEIRLLGGVDNVSQYLQAADIFVSTSRAEGLPNSVIEALGCGLPVVLSDIPPHLEIYELDKGIGEIFPSGNIDKITACMESVMNADREAIKEHTQKVVKNHLSAYQMAKNYMKIYEEIVRAKFHFSYP